MKSRGKLSARGQTRHPIGCGMSSRARSVSERSTRPARWSSRRPLAVLIRESSGHGVVAAPASGTPSPRARVSLDDAVFPYVRIVRQRGPASIAGSAAARTGKAGAITPNGSPRGTGRTDIPDERRLVRSSRRRRLSTAGNRTVTGSRVCAPAAPVHVGPM